MSTTLYSLGATSVAGYRVRTGDETTAASAVSGALVEAQSLLEEELRRLLPLEERTEHMVIDNRGKVWPKAYPLVLCATNTIDGRSLLNAIPDFNQFVAMVGLTQTTIRATITYTGGFDASTLPLTLAHAIYDVAGALVAADAPVPAGATSMSVGDVSVGFPEAGTGIDSYVNGLSDRVRKYRNRYVGSTPLRGVA
jgi:hypothetical protein